jgi:hypothetical protein
MLCHIGPPGASPNLIPQQFWIKGTSPAFVVHRAIEIALRYEFFTRQAAFGIAADQPLCSGALNKQSAAVIRTRMGINMPEFRFAQTAQGFRGLGFPAGRPNCAKGAHNL